jgi:alkyldihydroxyacetonephosphate synthase
MAKHSAFLPEWFSSAPRPGTYRAIFKWGYPDHFKHPAPGLYSLLKEKLQLSDADFKHRRATGDFPVTLPAGASSDLSSRHIERFRQLLQPQNVTSDPFARVKYASGQTAEELLQLRDGTAAATNLVLHPRDTRDVQAIVGYCNDHRIPIYIYGGGSSVNFGFKPVAGGVTLVMSTHMNRCLAFNETNQTITVQPGMFGPAYEQMLNDAPARFGAARPYTGGHFPQSFEFSTVGGWIAALGSGQQSTYYGDVYDLVVSQQYVTPRGSLETLPFPAAATGPKINDVFKGSEGTFGVLVAATLKIFRYMPQNRRRLAFVFPGWNQTVRATREITQAESGLPSVLRISDPEESEVAMRLYGVENGLFDILMRACGCLSSQRCLLIGQCDGEKHFARNLQQRIKVICRANGGMYLTGYPVKRWEAGRFSDPYLRDDLNDHGIMLDTLETAVTWDGLQRVYAGVRAFIKSRPNTICMTHCSHFYPQGTNLYFTFVGRQTTLAEYRSFLSGIIERVVQHGGSLSHHHGVGKLLSPWMERHLGSAQMEVLRALKKHFDPNAIMNPGGTLGLDAPLRKADRRS